MSNFDPAIFNGLWTCAVLAVAAASISITITQTEVFASTRAWTDTIHPMLGYLFRCFYCMNHWVIIGGVLLYRPILVRGGSIYVDLIVSIFFSITLSALVSGVVFKVFLTAMEKATREKELKRIASAEQ